MKPPYNTTCYCTLYYSISEPAQVTITSDGQKHMKNWQSKNFQALSHSAFSGERLDHEDPINYTKKIDTNNVSSPYFLV